MLIVDDDEQQRRIAQRLITELGYAVSAVPSGEAALEYLKSNTADIDIAVFF